MNDLTQTAARITRLPRPFDPDLGAEARAKVPDVTGELGELVAGAGGSAPYLAGLIKSENDWIMAALVSPEDALNSVLKALTDRPVDTAATDLRQAKRRVALLCALCDLGGIWSVAEVTEALTRFADAACDHALKSALTPFVSRGKLPGKSADDLAMGCGLSVLAMGKMGAHELNYSSDIDLICLFDETQFDEDDFQEARSVFVKATRKMCALLSDVTGDGYVFRTDLRLRPDPAVTPVAMAMEAAERYYESLGRTWERAAYIKARTCAGDIAAGDRFLQTLTPFVWRKHLDFAAIQDAHDMRLAIREHKGLGGPITLPGHNMKLGRGGIREIEFYTQTRQLIAGGRDADLRVKGTLPALGQLVVKGWVTAEQHRTLRDNYTHHRRVEHALQMVQDAQTHSLPKSDEGFDRLACLLATDAKALKEDLITRLSDVHETTEGFFAPEVSEAPVATVHLGEEDLARWLTFPALRSPRARQLLDRLRPVLETRLSQSARPDDALLALENFLKGLPAGVQVLSLFEANPSLIDLVLDIVTTSQALAEHLSRNAQVLDAVIGGDFFAPWPGLETLRRSLAGLLEGVGSDYEAALDSTRRWQKEWHFRIGVHLLRGLSSAREAGQHYADLARATLQELWPIVLREFERKHGVIAGQGVMVIGMGALGAGQMNARSDLDLIVLYDAGTSEASDGARPLATRTYFARLTQALITAISAPMSQGRLYEVDMRLRPSGNQGPVATSWAGFQDYQSNSAWTWEHLALSRADVVIGPDTMAQDFRGFQAQVLGQARSLGTLADDVSDMRAKIASAKSSRGPLDVKIGAGHQQDIELFAQCGTLLDATAPRDVAGGLAAFGQAQMLSLDQVRALSGAYDLFWATQLGGRLLMDDLADFDQLGPDGCDFMVKLSRSKDRSDMVQRLSDAQRGASELISTGLEKLREAGT